MFVVLSIFYSLSSLIVAVTVMIGNGLLNITRLHMSYNFGVFFNHMLFLIFSWLNLSFSMFVKSAIL